MLAWVHKYEVNDTVNFTSVLMGLNIVLIWDELEGGWALERNTYKYRLVWQKDGLKYYVIRVDFSNVH